MHKFLWIVVIDIINRHLLNSSKLERKSICHRKGKVPMRTLVSGDCEFVGLCLFLSTFVLCFVAWEVFIVCGVFVDSCVLWHVKFFSLRVEFLFCLIVFCSFFVIVLSLLLLSVCEVFVVVFVLTFYLEKRDREILPNSSFSLDYVFAFREK